MRAAPPHPLVLIGGGAALAATLALTLGAALVVASHADGGDGLVAADWRALRFTIVQASLSAAASVALAIPLARALSRRRFPGRAAIVALLGAPFLLPVVVAILGVIAVWGGSGWLSDILIAFGGRRLDVYGLPGVLIAHVFFNLPLATRILLQGYAEIPAERWRLAEQLGIRGAPLFRLLDRPMLAATTPGAFALIFLLCSSSFAVALALGGGPRATTIEVAIYQAVRFDFDLGKAALLATLQFLLGLTIALIAVRASSPAMFGPGLDAAPRRWDGRGRGARMFDSAVIGLAIAFLAAPLAAAAIHGVPGVAALKAGAFAAAARSIGVAVAAAAIAVCLGAALAALTVAIEARRPAAGRAAEAVGLMTLALSPFVAGVALFLVIRPFVSPVQIALPIVALVNALAALPFVLRLVLPALRGIVADFAPLAQSIGMPPAARARLLYAPRLRRPLAFAAGLSAALSMGDLGVVALFAPPDAPTLPLYMYGLMAAHRIEAAGGAALLLMAISFSLFWAIDALGRHDTA